MEDIIIQNKQFHTYIHKWTHVARQLKMLERQLLDVACQNKFKCRTYWGISFIFQSLTTRKKYIKQHFTYINKDQQIHIVLLIFISHLAYRPIGLQKVSASFGSRRNLKMHQVFRSFSYLVLFKVLLQLQYFAFLGILVEFGGLLCSKGLRNNNTADQFLKVVKGSVEGEVCLLQNPFETALQDEEVSINTIRSFLADAVL
eukprot:TRINITY_DN20395_c0_g1_i1.p2 TRINITY_DN20395_c0_g1~~TRINITY_DN20395_c0_g1_i1.p2  ORF type:complete len:201 (+),score=3.71 TRINITY_DN20395_c0_g1_i1:15-617(+)